MERILSQTLAYLGSETPLQLSFDIDTLDPVYAPSTGTPVRKGQAWSKGLRSRKGSGRHGRLVGMDLVEVNPLPEKSGAKRTLESACRIIETAIARGP